MLRRRGEDKRNRIDHSDVRYTVNTYSREFGERIITGVADEIEQWQQKPFDDVWRWDEEWELQDSENNRDKNIEFVDCADNWQALSDETSH